MLAVRDHKVAERRARQRRIEEAAFNVGVGLQARSIAEVQIGASIEALYAEGLGAHQVREWCGGLSLAEIRRLRQLARDGSGAEGESREVTRRSDDDDAM